MRGTLVILAVLAMVAGPAAAEYWYGPTEYTGTAFMTFGDSATGVANDVDMRFTARTSQTIGRVGMQLDSTTNYNGAPSCTFGVYADDGAGNPGMLLGASPVVSIPSAAGTPFVGALGTAVTLTPGNVYHVRMTYAGAVGSAETCRVRIGATKADLDERSMLGAASNDPNLAGMFYLTGDPIFPDGWYEGRPAEFTKVWDPICGLYAPNGAPLSEGLGCDKRYYDRSDFRGSLGGVAGNSFILNAPGLTKVDKIRVDTKFKATDSDGDGNKYNDLTDLVVKLLDASGTVLTQGSLVAASAVGGTNIVSVPQVSLTQGQRYSIVIEHANPSYANHWEPYCQDYGTMVGEVASWQGQQAYGLGTAALTPDQTREYNLFIPEPATLSLLVLGGLVALRRRRR